MRAAGRCIARLRRRPLWVQVHGIDAWQPRGALDRRGLAAAELVTSVSRYTRARLLAWADLAPHECACCPTPWTTAPAAADGAKPRELARRTASRPAIVLTVGPPVGRRALQGPRPGHRGAARHSRRRPRCTYLIVGDGDDRPRLERLARGSGVGERVCFAGQVGTRSCPIPAWPMSSSCPAPARASASSFSRRRLRAPGHRRQPRRQRRCAGGRPDRRAWSIRTTAQIAAAVIEPWSGRHPVPAPPRRPSASRSTGSRPMSTTSSAPLRADAGTGAAPGSQRRAHPIPHPIPHRPRPRARASARTSASRCSSPAAPSATTGATCGTTASCSPSSPGATSRCATSRP